MEASVPSVFMVEIASLTGCSNARILLHHDREMLARRDADRDLVTGGFRHGVLKARYLADAAVDAAGLDVEHQIVLRVVALDVRDAPSLRRSSSARLRPEEDAMTPSVFPFRPSIEAMAESALVRIAPSLS